MRLRLAFLLLLCSGAATPATRSASAAAASVGVISRFRVAPFPRKQENKPNDAGATNIRYRRLPRGRLRRTTETSAAARRTTGLPRGGNDAATMQGMNMMNPLHSLLFSSSGAANRLLQTTTKNALMNVGQSRAAALTVLACCAIMKPYRSFVGTRPVRGRRRRAGSSSGSGMQNRLVRARTFWTTMCPLVAHYHFANAWLGMTRADRRRRDEVFDRLHDIYAPRSMDMILNLRGMFIKMGQVLSSRADFIPMQYMDLFATLQDDVPPRPFHEVKQVVSDALRQHPTNPGLQFDDVFCSFDETPLGTASIGQVHRATLRPSHLGGGTYTGGKEVAVKVMDPTAKGQFKSDLNMFRLLCRMVLPTWLPILTELERQAKYEFDYVEEACALERVRANMKRSKYASDVVIPEPVKHLCTWNLLVMEKLNGKKMADAIEEKLATALNGNRRRAKEVLREKQRDLLSGSTTVGGGDGKKERSILEEVRYVLGDDHEKVGLVGRGIVALRLRAMNREIKSKLDLLLDVHGHQICQNGCFNSDPHPGNVLMLSDGRLGLIDYGQVKRLSTKERLALCKVIKELGRSDACAYQRNVADAMREFGFRSKWDKDDVLAKTAVLYFDSDAAGREHGFDNPQLFLAYLMSCDPMLEVPDAAVMVARASFLFRGMGSLLRQQVSTAQRWSPHAHEALRSFT